MSEYATIEHYVNHVMDEITKRDVEQVSERLRALGWEEVVRCRDCKHFYEDRRDTSIGWVNVFVCDSKQWSTSSLMPSHTVEPDGFCAWGTKTEFVTCKCGEDIERIDRIQTCPSCGAKVVFA